MIVTPDRIVVLEANTVPGMTATSLFPRCAKIAGIEFPDLLARIINLALEGKR
jgi:D-alanine-D-alanine ligase